MSASDLAVEGPRGKVLFVSTYPPTRCGIASYTSSLVEAIRATVNSRDISVARLMSGGDMSGPSHDPGVIAQVRTDDPRWPEIVAESCDVDDILWIQHEYGIFGPDDGIAVVELARRAPAPVAVTLHTVPGDPTVSQRDILETLCSHASWVVVMSAAARERLLAYYDVERSRVQVIPHGAFLVPTVWRGTERPLILTWGLIGPGKGLEAGITAMSKVRHLDPAPRYVIEGVTHPNVLQRDGEAYRERLERLISKLGVEDLVEIDSGYLSPQDLAGLLQRAHLVLLPYESRDQVTSGVLVEAIGAGIPVVATAFPHAVELLSEGAGTVVPHDDPDAIAAAVSHYLTDPVSLRHARSRARALAHDLSWPKIALQSNKIIRDAMARGDANVA